MANMRDNRLNIAYFPVRKHTRLANFDYTSRGAYTITACTRKREPFFSLPPLRLLLEEEWHNLPKQYVGVSTDTLVIMPDHLHCLLWLNTDVEKVPPVWEVLKVYKSIVNTKWIQYAKNHQLDGPWKLWQKNFYDHVVRHDKDLENQRKYMQNNPLMAELKCTCGEQ